MVFNPRLREGGDLSLIENNFYKIFFNPRLREGGDNITGKGADETSFFQSTPPRRRRLDFSDNGVPNYGVFNPRLREGGDRSTAIYI